MIGWTAKKLLSELPTVSPCITSVSLNTYAPAPVLAARLDNRDVARVRGLCSRVTLRGGEFAQLPLLDFQCEVREQNVDAIMVTTELQRGPSPKLRPTPVAPRLFRHRDRVSGDENGSRKSLIYKR